LKAITPLLTLVFSLVTAGGSIAADQTPVTLEQVDSAIKLLNSKRTEPPFEQPAQVLEEDTLEEARILMQDGVNLLALGQSEKGNEKTSRALKIISNYEMKKHGQWTDAELDLRAATLRIYEQVSDGPCTYMKLLERRIKRAWFPLCCNGESQITKVLFRLHKNGKISDLRITRSAACASSNQAALNAVQNAAPFYPLPLEAPPSVLIEFTFDYNVFKKLEAVKVIHPSSVLIIPACN
jgi:TonB family protein